MIAAIVYQLTRNLTPDQIKQSGFETYFVDHTSGIYPQAAAGYPFTAAVLQSKGDAITDLFEDLAADGAGTYGQHAAGGFDKTLSIHGEMEAQAKKSRHYHQNIAIVFMRFDVSIAYNS